MTIKRFIELLSQYPEDLTVSLLGEGGQIGQLMEDEIVRGADTIYKGWYKIDGSWHEPDNSIWKDHVVLGS